MSQICHVDEEAQAFKENEVRDLLAESQAQQQEELQLLQVLHKRAETLLARTNR